MNDTLALILAIILVFGTIIGLLVLIYSPEPLPQYEAGMIKTCDICGKEFALYIDGMRSQICDDVRYYCHDCCGKYDFDKINYQRLKATGFGGND